MKSLNRHCIMRLCTIVKPFLLRSVCVKGNLFPPSPLHPLLLPSLRNPGHAQSFNPIFTQQKPSYSINFYYTIKSLAPPPLPTPLMTRIFSEIVHDGPDMINLCFHGSLNYGAYAVTAPPIRITKVCNSNEDGRR